MISQEIKFFWEHAGKMKTAQNIYIKTFALGAVGVRPGVIPI